MLLLTAQSDARYVEAGFDRGADDALVTHNLIGFTEV